MCSFPQLPLPGGGRDGAWKAGEGGGRTVNGEDAN